MKRAHYTLAKARSPSPYLSLSLPPYVGVCIEAEPGGQGPWPPPQSTVDLFNIYINI
jgi:hypothetical protein